MVLKPERGWQLWGMDGFDHGAEPYHLDGRYEKDFLPEYGTRLAAEEAANKRLAELDRTQASAGGQNGIQDRVFIREPDGTMERVLKPFPARRPWTRKEVSEAVDYLLGDAKAQGRILDYWLVTSGDDDADQTTTFARISIRVQGLSTEPGGSQGPEPMPGTTPGAAPA